MSDMNEIDLVDVLYSIRKFTACGLHHVAPKFLNTNLLFKNIN